MAHYVEHHAVADPDRMTVDVYVVYGCEACGQYWRNEKRRRAHVCPANPVWRHGHRDGFDKACVVYAMKVCLCQICRGMKRNAGAQTRLIARVNAVDRC